MYKQAQDVSTIAKDGPLKSRGMQHSHPGAHQRSVLLCTTKKAHVFDGYLLTWPQHHIGPRARGFGLWKAERKRVAVRRGPTWELGHSSEGLFFQIVGFSQVPQSCFVLALSDLHLECSTQPFSFLLQCTSRHTSLFVLAKCAILQALESAIATAGDCWGFPLQTRFES